MYQEYHWKPSRRKKETHIGNIKIQKTEIVKCERIRRILLQVVKTNRVYKIIDETSYNAIDSR